MARRLDEWQLDDYLRAFWVHKWSILAITLTLGGLRAVSAAQQPNLYKATTRILIETQSPKVVQFQEMDRASYMDRAFLQTEYQVIGSRTVMTRVVEELHLAAFPPFSRAKDPVALLTGMVAVEPVRGTKLVDISVIGTKPELAARIANAVADTYARLNLERRRDVTTGGVQWLQDEVQKMEEKMRSAQTKLLEFRERHGTVDLGQESQGSVLQRLQSINAALTKTREDRIDAEIKYREKHPVLQEHLAKERELQLALFEQEQKALELNRLSIEFNTLMREAKTSETIYNILLTRLKELSVQEGLQTNNVMVVDYAQVPSVPIGPARARQTGSFFMIGLLLGVGIAVAREFFTETIRTRQDFEQLLGIPFLGYIPLFALERERRAAASGNLLRLRGSKTGPAETLSSIRTTLEFILPAAESHTLLITSAVPEEGKTTTCANLALALHELGRKVLVIDADMRRPSMHRAFNLPLEPGLSEFLEGKAAEEDLFRTTEAGLTILPAGLTPTQPTDLLSSPRFREALARWAKQYQYILIDSPPVLVAADASVLSTCTEGVLFILRANRTHSEVAAAAKQRLVDVGAKLVGGILNGARLEMERGYRYYYSYRYYRDTPGRKPRSSHRIGRTPSGEAGPPESAQGA